MWFSIWVKDMIEHHKQSKESSEIAMISMDYNKLCYLNEL